MWPQCRDFHGSGRPAAGQVRPRFLEILAGRVGVKILETIYFNHADQKPFVLFHNYVV